VLAAQGSCIGSSEMHCCDLCLDTTRLFEFVAHFFSQPSRICVLGCNILQHRVLNFGGLEASRLQRSDE